MDETGTLVVQSVRLVPEEQRYDHRLLQSVRGTPWEPNPSLRSCGPATGPFLRTSQEHFL